MTGLLEKGCAEPAMIKGTTDLWQAQSIVSIAISLKRIADAMDAKRPLAMDEWYRCPSCGRFDQYKKFKT